MLACEAPQHLALKVKLEVDMIKVWKKSLLFQLVGSFTFLSLSIVTLVGYVAFIQARASLKQSVFDRLTTAASLKEGELNRWLLDSHDNLLSLGQLSEVKAQAKVLLTQKKSTPEYGVALANLQVSLNGFIRDRSDYREIILSSKGGRVLMSTNPDNIGSYKPLDQDSDAIRVSGNTILVSNFYQSADTQQPTATFSMPILDDSGKSLGLLAVHLNLDRIDNIIRDNRGLGVTGETYLVANLGNNFSNRNAFVSAERFGTEEFPDGIDSLGISEAMVGNDGFGFYLNYEGIPVVGVYQWLEYQDVALLVEIEQQEAFAPARQLAQFIIIVGLGLSGIMTLGMVMVGRRIVKPILAIAQTARVVGDKVEAGNLANLQLTPVLTENEIGVLAHTFNGMTQQLQLSYEKLQEYSHTLEEKVAARTKELKGKNEDLESALRELRQTQTQLIQNEKMVSLGQMVAGVAHEINNPANFIHGNLDFLHEYVTSLLQLIQLYEEEYPTENSKIINEKECIDFDFLCADLPKVMDSMKLGTERIREIVLSLRNFSRLDEAELKDVDLHDGIESTLLILHNRLKAKFNRPEIQIIREYEQLPKIECYPSQLNQVFLNLIANAIDALEPEAIAGNLEKPFIRIHTTLQEKWVRIHIVDNGPGMSEKNRQKIFDPFFTTKSIGKGTGLGLSISYSIVVERHGGKLSCISTPGNGAEFIIAIPA